MKTTLVVFGLLLVGCTAPVSTDPQQPAASSDPNAFRQPGGNSYSAPPNGEVVVLDTIDATTLHGTPSSDGRCLIDQSASHPYSLMYFKEDGTVWESPIAGAVGSWKQTGTSDEVCVYGNCQTCSVSMGTSCSVTCPAPITAAVAYTNDQLIPFAFNCVNDVCTTLGGASVNADGTITYGGVALGTWKGTHVEAEICFGTECSLFHPTP